MHSFVGMMEVTAAKKVALLIGAMIAIVIMIVMPMLRRIRKIIIAVVKNGLEPEKLVNVSELIKTIKYIMKEMNCAYVERTEMKRDDVFSSV